MYFHSGCISVQVVGKMSKSIVAISIEISIHCTEESEVGGWRLEDGGWRIEVRGWRHKPIKPHHRSTFVRLTR